MLKRALIVLCFMITACTNQVTSAPASISTSTDTPSLGDHFPQLINIANAYVDLPLMEGQLVLDNGCLRVNGVKNMRLGDSFLIIWDSRFSTRTEQGVVQVIDSSTEEMLVSVGDYVSFGGGVPTEMDLREPIPDECPGPYYLVGNTIKKIDRPSLGAHFPQLITPQNVYLEALIKGKLVLENGCLRMSGVDGAVNGSTFLLIWDQKFSTRTKQGVVQVIDKGTGEILASVGDFVAIGGGFVDNPTSRGLREPIPDDCPGSYWLVGESIKKIDRP